MTTSQQKKVELVHLEKTFEILNIKDYSITDENNESPDFLIEIDGNTIGIEITSLFRMVPGGNSAKIQSDIQIITENAINKYNEMNGVPLAFCFGYDGNVAVNSRNKTAEKLGKLLYEYTRKHFPNGMDSAQEINVNQANCESLSFLNSIYAKSTDNLTSTGCLISGFDSALVTSAEMEKVVRKKEILLPKYKKRCEVIWLIIVLPSMLTAAGLELEDEESIQLSHEFDAVFILDEYRNQVQHIKNPHNNHQ